MSFRCYSVFVLDDVHEYGRNGIDVLKKIGEEDNAIKNNHNFAT